MSEWRCAWCGNWHVEGVNTLIDDACTLDIAVVRLYVVAVRLPLRRLLSWWR